MTCLTTMRLRRLPYAALSLALTLAVAPDSGLAQTTEGETQDPASTLDTVVVTGIRSSIERAQAIKRDSVQIVDSIVSHDMGKLPDITVSAALSRVPGIQVSRGGGEVTGVLLRGLPNLGTTYNGREMFTAENRGVGFQDFPAGGVGGVDVYKSSTADLIEGGIAGSIDVRSRKPFDFPGTQVEGSYGYLYSDQADKPGFNANVLFSTRWQTGIGEMGFLINASKNRIHYLDSTREQGLVMAYTQAEDAPDEPAFVLPDWAGVFFGEGDRRRPAGNIAFQWRPNESWDISVDGLFMGYRNRASDRFLQIPLWDAETRFSNVVTAPGVRTPRAISATATGGLRPEGYQRADDSSTDNYQVGIGVTYTRDAWRWFFDVSFIDSVYLYMEPSVDYAYTSIPIRDLVFDIQDGGRGSSNVSFRDFDHLDPDNYVFRGFYERNYRASGGAVQTRTDMEFTPESGFITSIQAGLRATRRTADRHNNQVYVYTEGQGIPSSSLPLDFIISSPGFDNDHNATIRNWWTPHRDSIRANIRQMRELVGRDPDGDVELGLPLFQGREKAQSAYAQIKYEFNPGVLIDGALGMRAVRTDTDMGGLYDGREWRVSRNTYTDYLPNASMRMRLTDRLQLRLAATKNRTRPNFDQLNPTTTIGQPSTVCVNDPRAPDCIMSSNSGNVELNPLRSTNYDLSLEYYFAQSGAATLALFRRDVEGFIFGMTADIPDPDGIYNIVRHEQPENAGKGRLQGAEFGFSAFLNWDALPEWTKALGMQANYTYIDHCTELNPFLAETLSGCVSIPGVAKNAYNMILIYERPKFSARLAYNWRANVVYHGRVYDPVLGETGPTLPEEHQEYKALDFAMRYNPTPKISFSFDVNNILRPPLRYARQFNLEGDSFPYRIRVQERIWVVGMQFRF